MEPFLSFYQNLPSKISPFIFQLGGNFGLRWYSLAYVGAVVLGAWLINYRVRRKENVYPGGVLKLSTDEVNTSVLYCFFGIVIGARLGYILFYDLERFLLSPFRVLSPITFEQGQVNFHGIAGLSYHGAVVGFVVAFILFTKSRRLNFLRAVDFYIPVIAIVYTLGRLGNFMNGELYGRVTTVPWGMYFLNLQGQPMSELRHPSQLYEAFLEGIMVFFVLWQMRKLKLGAGSLGALYLISYGVARFSVEFFREPDAVFKTPTNPSGTVLGFLSMGQVLSAVMLLVGVILLYLFNRKPAPTAQL